ncbi:MAG TPA: response regulator transcription factor [Bacteroidia bacterium]|nr:response regulator transcription factor [Bacteroidia bacterium]
MKPKLLIAEDDPLLLKSLGFYLQKQGYDPLLVNDGNEAIAQIKEKQFDLIITDLNMPFANGLEIISLVRNELKRETPIIMLTSVGIETTELEAFRMGVNEFISKPFSPQVLGVRIEKILSQVKK